MIGRADERGLAELDRVADDAVEDVVVADDAQLVEHVAREVRPAVVERRQQSEDPQVAVQLEPDRVDDLDQVVEALHRVVLRLDRDDHAGRRDQAVDRQQPEVRRAIDEDVVVGGDLALERLAQDLLATERGEQLALGRREVDVRGRDVDSRGLGRQDHLGQGRSAVGEDVGHRSLDGVEVDAETRGQIRLRIHVDAQDAIALLGERTGEVDRRRRLADAALLVGDRDHVRHRGITSNLGGGASGRRGGERVPPCYPRRPPVRAPRLSTRFGSCSPNLWISEAIDSRRQLCGWLCMSPVLAQRQPMRSLEPPCRRTKSDSTGSSRCGPRRCSAVAPSGSRRQHELGEADGARAARPAARSRVVRRTRRVRHPPCDASSGWPTTTSWATAS